MRLARAAVVELLLADVALERFDAQMDPDVSGQVGPLDELLGAVGALVAGTVVDQHVVADGILAL